jgi:hypothetical protein
MHTVGVALLYNKGEGAAGDRFEGQLPCDCLVTHDTEPMDYSYNKESIINRLFPPVTVSWMSLTYEQFLPVTTLEHIGQTLSPKLNPNLCILALQRSLPLTKKDDQLL